MKIAICTPVYGDTRAWFTHSLTGLIIHSLKTPLLVNGSPAEVDITTHMHLCNSRVDRGTAFAISKPISVAGAISCTGNATLGDAIGDAHILNGTVTLAGPVNIADDKSGILTIGRFSAGLPQAYVDAGTACTAMRFRLAGSTILELAAGGAAVTGTGAFTGNATVGSGNGAAVLTLGANTIAGTSQIILHRAGGTNVNSILAYTDGGQYYDAAYHSFRSANGAATALTLLGSATAVVSGTFSCTGGATLGDATGDTHTINGHANANVAANTSGGFSSNDGTREARLTASNGATGAAFVGTYTNHDFVVGRNTATILTIGASVLNMASGVALQANGTQVVTTRRTGWGAPTGTATRTSFDTGTVTTAQLAERVKALIDDLTTHGLIGA